MINNDELIKLKEKYPIYKHTGNRFKDLTGKHIGMASFLYRTEDEKRGKPRYVCQCDCGKIFLINKSYSDCYTKNNKEKNINCGDHKYNNFIGKKIGKLLVLEKVETEKESNRAHFKCQCDCGEIEIISSYKLNFRTQCKKCTAKEVAIKNTINEIGNKYGNLVVIGKGKVNKNGAHWICKCSCGNIIEVRGSHLRDGTSKSCGCQERSYNEYKIIKLLESLNKKYISEIKFKELGNLRFDFYVENNYIIEYDGIQHFLPNHRGSLKEIHSHDLLKNKYCFDNNIPLIRIPYTENNNYNEKDLCLETTRFLLTKENELNYYNINNFSEITE